MNGKPIPFNPNKLVQIWKERGVQFKNSSIMTTEQSNDFHNSIQSVLRSRGATFFAQTHYCHMRSLNQQFRKINSFFLEIFVGMFAGAIMGLSLINESEMYQGIWIPPYSLMSPSPNEWQVPIWGLLIGITVALAAAPAGVKIYGEEKPVYWREVSSGHNSFAYYLGKFIGSVPRMAIASLHFASFYHFLAQPVISFYMQYLLILLQFFGVYGLSTIISMSKLNYE